MSVLIKNVEGTSPAGDVSIWQPQPSQKRLFCKMVFPQLGHFISGTSIFLPERRDRHPVIPSPGTVPLKYEGLHSYPVVVRRGAPCIYIRRSRQTTQSWH